MFKVFFLLILTLAAHAEAQTCGTVPSGMDCIPAGANKDVTAFSTCAKITNSHASGKALMIPLKTSAEWLAFRTKAPVGAVVGSCASARTYVVYSTPGSFTFNRPVDWKDSGSLLECVGGGGGGASGGPGGGEGGAYTAYADLDLTTYGNSLSITVGAGGAENAPGDNSEIRSAYFDQLVVADGGTKGGAAGAHMLPAFPAYGYFGGKGGSSTALGSGGGGGAAGPAGDGLDGGSTNSAGGGGGGGASGGTAGSPNAGGIGGAGGNGPSGSGGGAADTAATGGTGGGGGGGSSGGDGAKGSSTTNLGGGLIGPGGGGGGAGKFASGISGGGGRGAGGGGSRDGIGGAGGNGFCIISYVP
ncbi:MAG: hypothetical protein EON58_15295 [Alphaproteobacteria bacterium]|nr:MAG: hypothetical protein EON58_15295 [Alphaproteobacteria bacterium]